LHRGAKPLLLLLGSEPFTPSFFVFPRNVALLTGDVAKQPKLPPGGRKW
jgi:hypothetical protein